MKENLIAYQEHLGFKKGKGLITRKRIAFPTQFTCYFRLFYIPFYSFMLVLCVYLRYFTCRGLRARKQCETPKMGAKCTFCAVMMGPLPA